MVRTTQSATMAIHTPTTPSPSLTPSSQLPTRRTAAMDTMEMTMGTFTSPAARSALGSVKERGHRAIAQPLWMRMSRKAYCLAASDRL